MEYLEKYHQLSKVLKGKTVWVKTYRKTMRNHPKYNVHELLAILCAKRVSNEKDAQIILVDKKDDIESVKKETKIIEWPQLLNRGDIKKVIERGLDHIIRIFLENPRENVKILLAEYSPVFENTNNITDISDKLMKMKRPKEALQIVSLYKDASWIQDFFKNWHKKLPMNLIMENTPDHNEKWLKALLYTAIERREAAWLEKILQEMKKSHIEFENNIIHKILELNDDQQEIIDVLIKNGADINSKGNYGKTILHRMIQKLFRFCLDEKRYANGSCELINPWINLFAHLISKGADVCLKTDEGDTLLDYFIAGYLEAGWTRYSLSILKLWPKIKPCDPKTINEVLTQSHYSKIENQIDAYDMVEAFILNWPGMPDELKNAIQLKRNEHKLSNYPSYFVIEQRERLNAPRLSISQKEINKCHVSALGSDPDQPVEVKNKNGKEIRDWNRMDFPLFLFISKKLKEIFESFQLDYVVFTPCKTLLEESKAPFYVMQIRKNIPGECKEKISINHERLHANKDGLIEKNILLGHVGMNLTHVVVHEKIAQVMKAAFDQGQINGFKLIPVDEWTENIVFHDPDM